MDVNELSNSINNFWVTDGDVSLTIYIIRISKIYSTSPGWKKRVPI